MSNQLTYQDFSDNFITHVRAIEKEHYDEGVGTFDYGVGFNIICKTNNRVMYFEDHLNSGTLPQNYTEQHIVDYAWSNLKPTIKNWASSAINLPSLIGSQWTPSSNVAFQPIGTFDFQKYTTNFITNIARFEVYPPTDPKSWCVGFNVTSSNNTDHKMYIDTNVKVSTFAVQMAEDEILNMGFSNVKEAIGSWAAKKYEEPSIINTEYFGNSNIW